jgi:hypothetical protein
MATAVAALASLLSLRRLRAIRGSGGERAGLPGLPRFSLEDHLLHGLLALPLEVHADPECAQARLQIRELQVRPGQLLGHVVEEST